MGPETRPDVVAEAGKDVDKAYIGPEEEEEEEEDVVSPERKKRLLAACLCILGTELCERMAFIGLATNLSLYLKQYMGYSAANASQLLQVFKGTVFVTPLLGAYVADTHLGRYRTILWFSLLYLAGLLGVMGVNLDKRMRPRFKRPPRGGYRPTITAFWVFMYLIALGSGGIKPCVSSFGGDQFRESSPTERRYRSSFFNWFYFMVNLGSLVAALVVTPLQESKGYGIGFGIPAALFVVAVAVLVLGAAAKLYVYVPPEGSPLKRIFRVFKTALFTNAKKPVPVDPSTLYDPPLGQGSVAFRMGHTPRFRRLDRAAIPHGRPGVPQPSVTEVEETKALLSLLPLLTVGALFRLACDPVSTMMPFTGDRLERSLGSFKIPAASMTFANQAGMLLSVLAYDGIASTSARRGTRITAMQRIGFGMVIQLIALISAGLIEMARYRIIDSTGLHAKVATLAAAAGPKAKMADLEFTVPMSIWWHVIPNFLEGVSEMFVNAAAVEVFFTQVSEGTRSLANSLVLLAVGAGSFLAFGLNKAVAAATRNDPWISQNPLLGHYDWYMFLNAGIVAVAVVMFYFWVARRYKERPVSAQPMSMIELKLCADAGEQVYHTSPPASPRPPRHQAAAAGAGGAAGPLTPHTGGAGSGGTGGSLTPRRGAAGGHAAGGGGGGGGGIDREASRARMLSASAPFSDAEGLADLKAHAAGANGRAKGA